MEKCLYIGSCVNNPFKDVNTLIGIIDGAREIRKNTFLRNCEIDKETIDQINQFPNDYAFFKFGHNIYFFVNSAIEYFYKRG